MIWHGLLVKLNVYKYNIVIVHVVLLEIEANMYSSISSTVSILFSNIFLVCKNIPYF